MFCGGVFCSTGNICLGDGVCGVASEDSNTSTPVTTSSLMVGSGKPSPTAMGKPTGSTTTLASGTNIGAEATPETKAEESVPQAAGPSRFELELPAWREE